ncbi:uncharacterized protein TrAFT101_004139 [Trichoderma asperellum]|uniref:uncharacterized protein n=1 Tax=Trichoderma asperellum TaxID=101201 RepID=UPI0033277BDE|nr:hypothetical protein TrAFT101_004139 [Trichoderma asperellum]
MNPQRNAINGAQEGTEQETVGNIQSAYMPFIYTPSRLTLPGQTANDPAASRRAILLAGRTGSGHFGQQPRQRARPASI